MRRAQPLTLLLAVTLLVGCGTRDGGAGGTSSSEEKMVVAASFYPIAEIVNRVGGNLVDVVNLTPPGTDAHEVEPTAKQLQGLKSATLTFYLGGNFQPSVQKAIESISKSASIDLLEGLSPITSDGSDETDPHVWLDPQNMISMTREVLAKMSTARPQSRAAFEKNANDYIARLTEVGKFLDVSLSSCASRVLVTAHRSFTYLATRAHLSFNSLLDYSGEDSSTGKDLEALAGYLTTHDVSTLFYEEAIAKDSMQILAAKVGASTATLNPIESMTRSALEAGQDYVSIQRANIASIAKGLRCT